jgi:hypothetical protein
MVAAIAGRALTFAALLGAHRARDRFRSMTAGQLAEAMISLAMEPFTGIRTVNGEDLWGVLRRGSRATIG